MTEKITGKITRVFKPSTKGGTSAKTGRPWTLHKVGLMLAVEGQEQDASFTYSSFKKDVFDETYKILVAGNEVEVEFEKAEGENGKIYFNASAVHFINGKARETTETTSTSFTTPTKVEPFSPERFRDEFKKAQEETKELIPDGVGGFLYFNPTDILLYMILKKKN